MRKFVMISVVLVAVAGATPASAHVPVSCLPQYEAFSTIASAGADMVKRHAQIDEGDSHAVLAAYRERRDHNIEHVNGLVDLLQCVHETE